MLQLVAKLLFGDYIPLNSHLLAPTRLGQLRGQTSGFFTVSGKIKRLPIVANRQATGQTEYNRAFAVNVVFCLGGLLSGHYFANQYLLHLRHNLQTTSVVD